MNAERTALMRAAFPGGGELASAVGYTFDCMDIAEQEIKKAGGRGSAADKAFGKLKPTEPLQGKGLELYYAHVHELVGRARSGLSLAPATDAEVLGFLLDCSLKAPLDSQQYAVACQLWRCCRLKEVQGADGTEPWPGSSEELLRKLRRALGVRERR